jgi:hypothetical protein
MCVRAFLDVMTNMKFPESSGNRIPVFQSIAIHFIKLIVRTLFISVFSG